MYLAHRSSTDSTKSRVELASRRPRRSPGVALALVAILSAGAAFGAPARWTEAFASSSAKLQLAQDLPAQFAVLMAPAQYVGTLRYRLVLSSGGDGVRVRFSNESGDAPLHIAGASVGLAAGGKADDARPGTLIPLTFGGRREIRIPVGAPAISDPVHLKTSALTELVVSLFVPDGVRLIAAGGGAMSLGPGDQTRAAHLQDAKPAPGRSVVSAVLVSSESRPLVVVALGDSITDGSRSSPDALHSWPEALQRRITAKLGPNRIAIVNAGIAGNRVLLPGMGISALARLERDALNVPGVTHIVLLEGINDIGLSHFHPFFGPQPELRPEDLIAGYQQIIARAHLRGVKVIGGTLMPWIGASTYSAEKEVTRQAVNHWIRTSGAFDAVIDFEAAMMDAKNPGHIRADLETGDHLHPNDLGYRTMADAIDLKIFR